MFSPIKLCVYYNTYKVKFMHAFDAQVVYFKIKIMGKDLLVFIDSLLIVNHSFIFTSSLFIESHNSMLLLLSVNLSRVLARVVSSAYMMKSNSLLACGKSFIYKIKRRGPKIDPCGTPVCIGKMLDFRSSISVYCFRLVR